MAQIDPAHGGPAANVNVHHEASDVNIGGIFAFALGLFIAAVIIHFMVWLLFQYFSGREARRVRPDYPLAVGQEQRVPPAPRLQVNPREDLRLLRQSEDAVLDSYGWADKNAGVVRIPIDKAMELTVQRGLPAREESNDRR